MYPTLKLVRFIPPLEALPKQCLNETPLRAAYTITLGFYIPL
jgi:hypothetical protein